MEGEVYRAMESIVTTSHRALWIGFFLVTIIRDEKMARIAANRKIAH
jgi:hypothetical protein